MSIIIAYILGAIIGPVIGMWMYKLMRKGFTGEAHRY